MCIRDRLNGAVSDLVRIRPFENSEQKPGMLKSNAICLNYDKEELDEWFGGNIRGKYWTKPDASFEEMEREPYIDESRYTLFNPKLNDTYFKYVYEKINHFFEIGKTFSDDESETVSLAAFVTGNAYQNTYTTSRKDIASDQLSYLKGKIDINTDESNRPISDAQISWVNFMVEKKMIEKKFNVSFFSNGDSRNSEEAGILGAMVGSFLALMVTIIAAFPLGVMSAIYLEEFAQKNKFTNLIEVNINNLAAVPSIVFGLLGLAIFLNFFGLPRSSPLAGGLVLALMTLPTIIISSRVAIKSVPPSIREAAMGVGASKMQSVFHHVMPLAIPGILTGTIIGMARALGETAPLLMMGMVAFIVDVPQSITDPSTVLPAQIFLWSDQPERGFEEKTASATIILLGFLLTMNALAVFLRYKYERKW